jgi:hypothetical protein
MYTMLEPLKASLELTFGRSEKHLLRIELSAEDLDCIDSSFYVYLVCSE